MVKRIKQSRMCMRYLYRKPESVSEQQLRDSGRKKSQQKDVSNLKKKKTARITVNISTNIY